MSVLSFKDQVLQLVSAGVDEYVSDSDPSRMPSASDTASAMLAAMPTKSPYDDLAGPFYSSEGARKVLGNISRQALNERAARGTILRVQTADEHYLYPVFQFEQGAVNKRLRKVLSAFKGHDGWAVATWLSVPVAALHGRTPREVIGAKDDLTPVIEGAREIAQRWSAP